MAERSSIPLVLKRDATNSMPPTDLIPGYELIDWLGSGGMGDVYRACQLSLGRVVAIKIQRPLYVSPFPDSAPLWTDLSQKKLPTESEMFSREARLMAEVRHPNIVTVFDRGFVTGQYYTVMEFVEGTNLREFLPYRKPANFELTRRVISELVAALEMLHKAGIVHRDLKPENVLLDPEGHARLTDFGIALSLGNHPKLTPTDQILGTPDYMAPEQRAGFDVDTRADQYSLAVMAYEMLTGRVLVGVYRSVKLANPAFNSRLDAVLSRALEAEPEDRFESISAFGAAIQRALSRPPRRLRLPQVLAAGALATAMVGLGGWLWFAGSRRAPQTPVQPRAGQPTVAPVVKTPEPLVNDAEVARITAEIQQNPKYAQFYIKRALRHQALQKYDLMLADLDEAIRLEPKNADFYLTRGQTRWPLKDREGAIADFTKCLELNPTLTPALIARGWLYSENGQLDLAMTDLNLGVKQAPNEGLPYVYRATARAKIKDYWGAWEDLDRAMKLSPKDSVIHTQAAGFLLDIPAGETRNDPLALELAKRANELSNGNSWLTLLILGRAYAANQNQELAIQNYRESKKLAPVDQHPLLDQLILASLNKPATGNRP